MSNAFIFRNGGGGGGGDVTQVQTQQGIAVPAAGVLILNAFDTTQNNIFGIETKANTFGGNPPGTGNANESDVYLTNRFHGTFTSTDSSTNTIASMPVTITNGVVRVKAFVVGYNTTNNLAATTEINTSFRYTAGTPVLLANNYNDLQEDITFVGAVFLVGNVGNISITVAGQAANTINWVAVATYVQVGT